MLATALWGLAFLVTRAGVETVPAAPFVAVRFAAAALTIRGVTGIRFSDVSAMELRGGLLLGLAMLGGYALQASALRTLGAGHVAFISALYVPLIPILQFILLGRHVGRRVWLGVALATGGLMLIAGGPGTGFSRGDAFALAGAFAVAAELLLMARFAPQVEARRLALVECVAVSLYALVVTEMSPQDVPVPSLHWLGFALGLGLASAFLQVSSNWAMARVPVHRAMLIFATEPVWAALFGAFAGERMRAAAMAGAALIVTALLLNGRPEQLPVDPAGA